MTISKHRISSPLEAGASLLDAKQLPPQLTTALEYVSSKLARKALHLSLIVVRKEVQIPSLPSPESPKLPEASIHSVTTSPVRSLFNSATSFTKSISRHSSRSSLKSESSSVLPGRNPSSSSLSRTNWSSLPSSPRDKSASPPASPQQSMRPSIVKPRNPDFSNPYGISLIHAATLSPRAEKILRHAVAKAEKKYNIGSGWLPPTPLTATTTCALTNDLIRRSLSQNEVVFCSEGLTLLSLDHVYTFKCYLHTYSTTLSPADLTSAVDELRRLVLAQNGRCISKGYLMRAYNWLGVSLAALVDVNEGYKTAYGGRERAGGIEVQNEERQSPPPLKTSFVTRKQITRLKIAPTDSGERSPTHSDVSCTESEGSGCVAFGESAKGMDGVEGGVIVVEKDKVTEDRGPHRRGAVTPNGFEDITPVTKGEWCFLMVGEGWKQAKHAAVETC